MVKKTELPIMNSKKTLGYRIKTELIANRYLYILLIPLLAYYIIFMYLPMFGLVIAFKDYSIAGGIMRSPWVGLRYFKEFITGIYFTRTLTNTLVISFASILFGFPAPIIFALLLNEISNRKYKKLVQTATYLPHFISTVVICGMIASFFGTDGLITKIIAMLGGKNINYIASPKWFRLGSIMSVGYEKIILLYSPATYEVADVISSYVYRMGIMGSRYSYSAAVGLFQSVINIIILFIANKVSDKMTETSLF